MNKPASHKKTKLAAIFALSFAVSYMVFFFAPFETYLRSPHAFVIGWKFLLPQMAVFTIISFIALSLALLLLMLHKRALDVAAFLIWGLLLASYFQMLFLNGGMLHITMLGTIHSIPYLRLTTNLTIWVLIALMPLIVGLLILKDKKEPKYEKAVLYSALIILGMQTVGIISAAATADLPVGLDENPQYFTYASLTELSSDTNVLVFVLEHMDVRHMDAVLDGYPEIYDQLDGFTFYTNNISQYPTTFPQVAEMLTQHPYSEGQSRREYLEQAWSQHSFLDILKENGFTIYLHVERGSTYGNMLNLRNRADNTMAANSIKRAPAATWRFTTSISMARLVPLILKDFFVMNVSPESANRLFVMETSETPQSPSIGMQSDLMFYEHIKQNDMTAMSDKKVFSFVHLNSAHPTNTLRYDAEADTIIPENSQWGSLQIESKRANFEILNVYFQKLRNAGIYDNATIIVLGDHGRYFDANEPNPAVTTGLMIKPPGARGRLERNNSAELSHINFGASVLEAAGINNGSLGLSYFDIIYENLPKVRFFMDMQWSDLMEGFYEITGDANDFANWRRIE